MLNQSHRNVLVLEYLDFFFIKEMISSYGYSHFGWSIIYNLSCTCNTREHDSVKLRHGLGMLDI